MAPPAPAHSTWIGRCMPTRIFAHEAHGADGARTGRFQRKRPYFFHSRTRIGCADEAQKSAGACVHCGRRWPTPGVWPKNGPRGGIAHAHALCMRACPKHNGRSLGALGTGLGPLTHPSTHTGDPRMRRPMGSSWNSSRLRGAEKRRVGPRRGRREASRYLHMHWF